MGNMVLLVRRIQSMMKFQNRRQRRNLYKTSVNHIEEKTCGSMVTQNFLKVNLGTDPQC